MLMVRVMLVIATVLAVGIVPPFMHARARPLRRGRVAARGRRSCGAALDAFQEGDYVRIEGRRVHTFLFRGDEGSTEDNDND